jgi:hypothetical protein
VGQGHAATLSDAPKTSAPQVEGGRGTLDGVEHPAPAKRAKHLMDPANPVRQVNDRALTRVQRTVASALATTTILHLSAGLIIAAVFIDTEHDAARIGLNLIAGAFAVIAIGVGFAIHGRNPVSPWLLLGLVVVAIGLGLTYGL